MLDKERRLQSVHDGQPDRIAPGEIETCTALKDVGDVASMSRLPISPQRHTATELLTGELDLNQHSSTPKTDALPDYAIP